MPPKLDSSSTAVDKTLQLYEMLLFSQNRFTAVELADRLQCSKSTISRTIQKIEKRQGISLVREVEGKITYYSLARRYQGSHLSCSHEELESLRLCIDMARPHLSVVKYDSMSDLLDRLRTIFAPTGKALDTALLPISKTWIDYTDSREIISKLVEAIRTKKICNIVYQKGKQSPSFRILAPARLLSSSDALYIEGWSLENDTENPPLITIYIQRIKEVSFTEKEHRYTLPAKEKHYFGIMRGTPFPVRVHFDASAAEYIKERRCSDDQEIIELPDGDIELRFTAQSDIEVISWILSFGSSAEICEPADLRERMKTELEKTLEAYL